MQKETNYLGFELGPIRPPSEAYSLLLRLVRGCAWNKCKFCAFYRGERFRVRPLEHVKQDIDTIRSWIDVFEGKSQRDIRDEADYESYYMAASWYQSGMESVFFQDANSLLTKPDDMIAILEHLRAAFPQIERITTYARSDTIARIPDDYLSRYAELGLNRFHIGMETGCDELLRLVNKGTDRQTHIIAGQKAMRAGIEASEFYMPGLGGKEYAAQSARETAEVINLINPDFVRIRSMALSEKLELYADYQNGTFTRTNDVDDVREIRQFIEGLGDVTCRGESDHVLNGLLELEGQMPQDKARILATIDRFLNMPEEEQMMFRLGRRVNAMSSMNDMQNLSVRRHVEQLMQTHGIGKHNIDQVSAELMVHGIPVQDQRKDYTREPVKYERFFCVFLPSA